METTSTGATVGRVELPFHLSLSTQTDERRRYCVAVPSSRYT